MSTTTNLTTLKINYLTQQQYETALENEQIQDNELYFTDSTAVQTVTLRAIYDATSKDLNLSIITDNGEDFIIADNLVYTANNS